MYSKGLLVTGIAYGAGKRELIQRFSNACDSTVTKLSAMVDAYDKAHPVKTECLGNIMCERTGIRHKADCIGKVEPIDVFWKKVQQ